MDQTFYKLFSHLITVTPFAFCHFIGLGPPNPAHLWVGHVTQAHRHISSLGQIDWFRDEHLIQAGPVSPTSQEFCCDSWELLCGADSEHSAPMSLRLEWSAWEKYPPREAGQGSRVATVGGERAKRHITHASPPVHVCSLKDTNE